MSFTTVVPYNPDEAQKGPYIPIRRCRNKLLIARPLKYQKEGFITKNAPDGTDVVFVDYALLDAMPEAVNEMGETLPGFPAGQQFRDQSVLQRYLIGTFKRYIGHTLIGTIYFGPATQGMPPIMWQDLSDAPDMVARGQQFLAAHPEFLIPVEAQITPVAPDPAVTNAPPFNPTAAALAPIPGTQVAGAPTPISTLEQMRAQQGSSSSFQGNPPF